MRIPRIFTDQPLVSGATIDLEESAARHLGSALRMQAGQALTLFNGQGGEYSASISEIGKKAARILVGEHQANERESPLNITLAIGLSRGDRFDFIVQKATELGVSRIVPLLTERTEVKLKGERRDKKVAHWQQIAISACEQCQRNRIPEINEPQPLAQWQGNSGDGPRLVLHHRSDIKLADMPAPDAAVTLLIGPEGGLSEAEIDAAISSGFQPLTLGPRVMRTETAPLAALAILQARWGDLG